MFFLVHTKNGAVLLQSETVVYCQADGKVTNIYYEFQGGLHCQITIFGITQLQEILPNKDFYVAHRSTIIGLIHFKSYNSVEDIIHLAYGASCKLAKARKADFKAKLMLFIEKENTKLD